MLVLNIILLLTKSVTGDELAVPKIVNGTMAEPGQFPFAVALLANETQLTCTGTLIMDWLVLTAAHCIGHFVYVLAGDTRINGTANSRQLRNVLRGVPHPGFPKSRYAKDLGLVSVDVPFVLSEFVKPINLCDEIAETGEICVHVGWGNVDEVDVGGFSNNLMYHELAILGTRECRAKIFFRDLVCAASAHSRPCFGDSGGPLVCHEKLCGVTSATRIHKPHYNLFGNVPDSKNWILSNGTKGEAPSSLHVRKKILIKVVLIKFIIATAKCHA